jgi:hypothetical protein
MDTVVAELVSFLQVLQSGSLFHYLILLVVVLIGLALIIAAVACQRIVIKPSNSASKATQENFETIAADLRKRALEVKRQDEGLRKRDLEVKERDELKGFVKDANAELRCEPQRPQQQRQMLKGSQRALKQSVSHIITVGLKDIQNRSSKHRMTSVVPDSSKADLQRKPDEAALKTQNPIKSLARGVPNKERSDAGNGWGLACRDNVDLEFS